MKVTAVGILVADIIAAELPKVASPGEVIFAPRGIKTRIGGHPANVSIDLVKLGLRGDDIAVIGAVGDDTYGRFIEETLAGYGIKTFLYKVSDVGTSKNLILVVKGEDRRFHVDVGANVRLDPIFVEEKISKLESDILYIGATGWLGNVDLKLPYFLKDAKERGQLTFVDIIAPYGKEWSYIIPSLAYTDIFHCNLVEASNIVGTNDLSSATKAFLDKGVKLVIITLGEEGLYARSKKWSIRMGAFKVNVIDPTGAGDAFCAGVIYELVRRRIEDIEDLGLDEALDILTYASAVGASATTKEGTTEGVERSFIDKLVEEQGDLLKKEAKTQVF